MAPAFTATAQDAGAPVVSVGERHVSAGEIARRLQALPPYQLKSFGSTPAEIRTRWVDRVLVPELLADAEAERQKLRQSPALSERIRGILVQALENELRSAAASSEAVSDAAVRAHFEANRKRFETPRRIRIWRIAVRDEAEARRVLAEARGSDGVKKWSALAREKSQDKATYLRDGDLGFVREDGTTDAPQLRVDPALFAAVDRVREGELVPEPIREGEFWSVLWRRGSMPAVARTLEQEAASIRHLLTRQKLEGSLNTLTADLKKQHVSDLDYDLLDYVKVDAFGSVAERERPGIVPRRRARATPEKGDLGYR